MINLSDHKKIESVIGYFLKITEIPRGSGNTKAISEFLYSFGKERGLETYRDEYDNVVIKKPATKGYEHRPTLVLQGHSDMVCEKDADCAVDMTREGVSVFRDGDFLKARGTTLGADDGIALAYALAILDSEQIEHPRLECVFTSDEETGLTGAMNISPQLISGRMMINLDSGDEGVFTVGCAGGLRSDISLPVDREPSFGTTFALSLEGLLGGHSGVEIDKGRINALKVLGEAVSSIPSARIISFKGGNADNAIPREAYAVVCTENEINDEELSRLIVSLCQGEKPVFKAERCESKEDALTYESTRRLLSLIGELPTGVYGMSGDIEGLVETSSNVAVARTEKSSFELTVSIRSSVGERKDELAEKVRMIAEGLGASVSRRGDYPGWAYKKDSALREVMKDSWKKLFHTDAEVIMIHAGLECGIFSDKLSGLDCVSTGPNHYDIHTPKERLSLSSTERVWELLLEIMKNI